MFVCSVCLGLFAFLSTLRDKHITARRLQSCCHSQTDVCSKWLLGLYLSCWLPTLGGDLPESQMNWRVLWWCSNLRVLVDGDDDELFLNVLGNPHQCPAQRNCICLSTWAWAKLLTFSPGSIQFYCPHVILKRKLRFPAYQISWVSD